MVATQNIISVLSGAWSLINTTAFDKDGVPSTNRPPLGYHPKGQLIYHPTGYMSANLQSTDAEDRPPTDLGSFPPENNDTDTLWEWALMGAHTLSYAGPFSIVWADEEKLVGEAIHGPLTMSMNPVWEGSEQKRNFSVLEDGNVLWITGTTNSGSSELYWRRLS